MTVTSSFKFAFRSTDDGDLAENIAGPAQHVFDYMVRMADGTSDAQADVVWSDRRTLGATSNETLDLAGSLTNSFGSTVTFAEVIGILIRNRETTASALLHVGGDATNGVAGFCTPTATGRIIVRPGTSGVAGFPGFLFWFAPVGISIGAGSSDELYCETPAGAVTYDIAILGRSA